MCGNIASFLRSEWKISFVRSTVFRRGGVHLFQGKHDVTIWMLMIHERDLFADEPREVFRTGYGHVKSTSGTVR